jgi:hypothetical protein
MDNIFLTLSTANRGTPISPSRQPPHRTGAVTHLSLPPATLKTKAQLQSVNRSGN